MHASIRICYHYGFLKSISLFLSEIYAFLCLDAFIIGMLDQSHLSNHISSGNKIGMRIPAGENEVKLRRLIPDQGKDISNVD